MTNNRQPNHFESNNFQPNNRQSNNRQSNNRQPNNRQSNNRQPNNRQPNNRQSNNRQSNNRQSNNRHTKSCPVIYRLAICGVLLSAAIAGGQEAPSRPAAGDKGGEAQREAANRFQPRDVFGLEYASAPQISPDGTQIVYVRNSMDIMVDRQRSSLWSIRFDGTEHRPLATSASGSQSQPVWDPSGQRLAYVSSEQGSSQIYVRWMDTGQTARLTQLTESPRQLSWSPDGKWLAFAMRVSEPEKPFATLPEKPAGAEWAAPPKVIRSLKYRADGQGYLKPGYEQLFVLPADGGSPRQVTFGDYHHDGGFAWTPASEALILAANRQPDWEHDPLESELFELRLADGRLTPLTDRNGPDRAPAVSPDGKLIAYLGFDDRLLGYHQTELYVINRDGTQRRQLTAEFDRTVSAPVFAGDGAGIYFQYDDQGTTKIGYVSLEGQVRTVAAQVGGESLGRPYASGSFSVSRSGRVAYTQTSPARPADVAATGEGEQSSRRLTSLNEDLLGHKQLGTLEELRFKSKADAREIQAWCLLPPGFSPKRKYPLILEIHGGPFANYGPRFSAEMQLYAAAGYVVLYVNPRGSTGYGQEFAHLIHHNYPGEDYDDLMSAVEAVEAKGYIAPGQLYVTGGSGGGVLTAWIVGKTNRFRAAVVAKPVINWYSFALTADAYNFFYKYWFPGLPWDHPEQYLRRSPISLVGNVSTPTMLLTGEEDFRTPMSETEQFYQALKLRNVDAMLVRIPGASHAIAARPSRLVAKTAHVLAWFEKYHD